MAKNNESNEELKVLLQRQASGRTDETTFDKTPVNVAAEPTTREILEKAGKRALGGGLPGAMAMGIQVGSLMWLRTTMNYQYRYGTSTTTAIKHLYAEGGIRRFYRGVGPALFQGPLSRFGDTAANAGMLTLLNSNESTKDLPVAAKTFAASVAAGFWRMFLMPIDCLKTTLQVEGKPGLGLLKGKIAKGGPKVLYYGAFGAAGATMVGHYPWFFTHNLLDEKLPKAESLWGKLGRNALMGFCSSFVSDCCSNSIRVVKTTKQTSAEVISYPEAARLVIKSDGVSGLFIRGLQTRILANGFQGMLFTILWKGIQERFFDPPK
uniref:Uncharacterized protein n=1 Tax=Aplanochytrium stocchinoi TaxID=215587 RepID=A0A7S3PF73_9STRA|mmetsp:Transcript_90/g.136  ORF Transcript_90/g.136 Transcript_90/m.136 type:complete len:322 (+) Transcript_90:134-1099(+)|eukprot:CAMPEP_0204837566 /NCGR_PEP_ID=MMETSP1346-20131115/28276_1 /ASSEMBLY_ACC=CAM_ASM_000771 /TAXON_ID=215587 /ORGANISM="Aplanochytrium stocchinoi, Strain GSBS06" /LENGTH=321 /DNA_ID=CAMNT_0051973077 /DNA_START=43 /DNA_END=1008 /DNA_ORIENTATION=-